MLSVIIITLNEEQKLRDCLESVKWAEEIIVVDSYSQDKTVQIAKEYTSKVYQRDFSGDGLMRNYGIGKARGDWILIIDADERVTPELCTEIKETLKNPHCDGYYIPRKVYFLGKWIKHCGWWPDYVLRLFRKSKGQYDKYLWHAKVVIKAKAEKLKNPLLHYTCTDLGDYIARINARSSGMAKTEKQQASLLKCLLHGWARFIKTYFVKTGFLDGREGLILSIISSYSIFLKYLKVWEKGRINSFEMKERQK